MWISVKSGVCRRFRKLIADFQHLRDVLTSSTVFDGKFETGSLGHLAGYCSLQHSGVQIGLPTIA